MISEATYDWPFEQPRNCATVTVRQVLVWMDRSRFYWFLSHDGMTTVGNSLANRTRVFRTGDS